MSNVKTYSTLKQQEQQGLLFFDYFIYVAEVSSMTAAASLSDIINIQADSDFILDKLAYFSEIAGAAQTDSTRVIPLINVSITDTGSGRSLQDTAVPISLLAGDGRLPFVLSQPRIFSANSTIQVAFTNVSAGTTYATTKLAFIGRKVFRY